MVLYDEQKVMRSYVESEVYEARQEGIQEGIQDEKIETAKRMLEDGTLPLDKIAKFSNLPIEVVKHLADNL